MASWICEHASYSTKREEVSQGVKMVCEEIDKLMEWVELISPRGSQVEF